MIRTATQKDVARMLEIYTPYVEKTAISFEYEAPSLETFENRFRTVVQRYPWLVWEENGQILGYAYASAAFVRKAYQWDADFSIYLDWNARGRGIGAKLYDCLETVMKRLGYHNLYALVSGGNTASRHFHEKRGYELQGILKNAGYKLGNWHDVCWYALSSNGCDPAAGIPENFTDAVLRDLI